MTIKRAPPNIVFTIDERKRVATVVTLLVTIAKRVKVKKSILLHQAVFVKTTPAKGYGGQESKNNGSYFVKTSKDKKTKHKYENRGSWLHGPLLCQGFVEQACFYLQLIYLKATNIDSILAQLLT